MDHREERTKEPVEEVTEEQFLKDLYLFMKKRDTPIERIPHLGFKQIDLFVMFKTVNDLGGYQQVTTQQLWKQVYNTLGGNPRSTSAATCTRRHYEKLLLPYECHVKGVMMTALPPLQPKAFMYASYSKDDDDGQRPAKRKMLTMALHQGPQNLQSDPHGGLFRLPLPYPPYYHPGHTVLPPYAPISSPVLPPHSSPAPKPRFPFPTSCLNSTSRAMEPLEHLRYLAKQFRAPAEPLNLSVKAPTWESDSNPVSSFAPPSSSKNPKFLNKPSTLYAPHHAGTPRNEGSKTPDGESSEGASPSARPAKPSEADVIDVDALTTSSSPIYDPDAGAVPQKPSSPKTDFTIRPREEREASPDVRGLSPGHLLPGLPREKDGKMEIEIPLSVFQSWLKLCRSSATIHEAKEPPLRSHEDHPGQRKWSDVLPTNGTFHMSPKYQSTAEDLSPRNVPSPAPTTQTTGIHHNTSQNCFSGFKPSPSGSVLKNAASQDTCPRDQQDIDRSHCSKATNFWDAYDKEIQAAPTQMKRDSSPLRGQQDFASKFYIEDIIQGGKQKPEVEPSALLMVDSSPASVLHLTSDEVRKLKKLISSSV